MTNQNMRILKIASCPNCTTKATVTYHIGYSTDKQINFRVVANSGGGLFSSEWVALSAIKDAFETTTLNITSNTLMKLFKGKSINTPGFLMAALKHEGLVLKLEGNQRSYEQQDQAEFIASMNALIKSDINLSDKNPTSKSKPIKTKKSISAV